MRRSSRVAERTSLMSAAELERGDLGERLRERRDRASNRIAPCSAVAVVGSPM
jgi:hypothetical protein